MATKNLTRASGRNNHLDAQSPDRHSCLAWSNLVTVPCQQSGVEFAGDSTDLRLELTWDDEPIVYCAECWGREFAE